MNRGIIWNCSDERKAWLALIYKSMIDHFYTKNKHEHSLVVARDCIQSLSDCGTCMLDKSGIVVPVELMAAKIMMVYRAVRIESPSRYVVDGLFQPPLLPGEYLEFND